MLPFMRHPLPSASLLRTLIPAIALLVAAHPVVAQSTVTFAVPGAHTTLPLTVNNRGVAAGLYWSDTVDTGAFVRDARGVVSTIELADATGFTQYVGLNLSGTVVGAYYSTSVLARGFVRTPDGQTTPFDVPGAGLTLLSGINDRGAMVGAYIDSAFSRGAGFVVSPRGEVEDVTGPGDHIYLPTVINTTGAIAGIAQEHPSNGSAFAGAFHRDASGVVSMIEIPHVPLNAATTRVEIELVHPTGINAAGTVTGRYVFIEWAGNTQIEGGSIGFLRHRDGSVETFALPGSPATYPWGDAYDDVITGLTAAGSVVGHRGVPGTGGRVSYVLSRNGRGTAVEVEGSLWTVVRAASPSGLMTGTTYLPDFAETGLTLGFISR